MTQKTILIDNYDSFTWNVYQSLSILGADVLVFRNDKIIIQEIESLQPRQIVISPGPGYPKDAGISLKVIEYFKGKVPILGVCLGEQCIYELFGGIVKPCGELVHGKTTPIQHDSRGIFKGVDQDIECTRYHSLAGDSSTLPKDLEVSARTLNGIVMGVRHKKYVIEGVQFHPESIASEQGDRMFKNFLQYEGGTWDTLQIRPEWIRVKKVEQEVDFSHGLPLSLASKMNSTARTWSLTDTTNTVYRGKTILETIVEQRRKDVVLQKQKISYEYLLQSYHLYSPPLLDFKQVILKGFKKDGIALFAEIKRASPSKGDISNVHASSTALVYANSGASVISVLTEPNWFKGSLCDLSDVRRVLSTTFTYIGNTFTYIGTVDERPAVLCKEFIVDEYQILEARLAGADTILLIVKCLTFQELVHLLEYARALGMEPLVEVSNKEEMQVALKVGSKVIGINNRDLDTFVVDTSKTNTIAQGVDKDVVLVALSGITKREDVVGYMQQGVKGVLVGEAIMRAGDKSGFIRSLLGRTTVQTTMQQVETGKTMVKVCGVTNTQDAMKAVEAGADYLGFIFADSPRRVDPTLVSEIIKSVRNHAKSPKPLFVGVFTTQTVVEINRIVDQTGLDLVQLHTPQPHWFQKLIKKPVVQVVSVKEGDSNEDIVKRVREAGGTYVLLDTATTQAVGGTGQVFKWDIVTVLKEMGIRVWMAGGLDPDNVSKALKYGPLVVDVCSGVEASKGVKDHSKLVSFVSTVRRT